MTSRSPVVYRSLEEIRSAAPACAVTIGNFDGVHVGHARLFRRVAEVGGEHGWQPSVLTFDPHPTKVVAPMKAPRLLSTVEERISLMAAEGIEQVFVLPFDRRFSELPPENFVKEVLVESLNAKAVLVGDNFRFGNRQAGDTGMLMRLGQQFGFDVETVGGVRLRGRLVSSSEVRRLVERGDASMAGRLLGRPYGLSGEVVPGHGVGKRQTVPTLNLATSAEILPSHGVYITCTHDLTGSRRWNSVTNVGVRPTFEGDSLSVETFLLSPFDGKTPERIRVDFLRRVRDERKFASPEELKAQIMRDVARAQAYFRRTGVSFATRY